MTSSKEEGTYYFAGTVEFIVVSIAFIFACSTLSEGSQDEMIKQALIFSCVVSASMFLARYLLAHFNKHRKVAVHLMLGNI
ncbi:MAG: hypothetical protein GY927_25635, partial [bacterium]|nr:hypothetical protein [bacterium]